MSRPGRTDQIAGGLLVLAGLAAGAEALTFDVAFMTDPVGPKAIPLLAAVIMVGVGVRTLLSARPTVSLPSPETALRLGAAVAAFVLYATALAWIGFFASTALVIVALARLYRGPLWPSVAASLAISGALWLLFVAALSLPLPVGQLWIR